MAKIIENTLRCEFCNCLFTVDKDDIKTSHEFSSVGTYHTKHYMYISCPTCGSTVKRKVTHITY